MSHIAKVGTKLMIGVLSLGSLFSGITNVSACGGAGGGGGGYYRSPTANYQPAYYPQPQTYYPQSQPYYRPNQAYPTAPVSYQQYPGLQQQPVSVASPSRLPMANGGAVSPTNGAIQQTLFHQPKSLSAAPIQQQLPTTGPQPTAAQNSVTATPVQPPQPQTPAFNQAVTTTPVSLSSTPSAASSLPPKSTTLTEQSALQALAGLGMDTTPVAATPTGVSQTMPMTATEYVGTWSASLPNGTGVQLVLQADGSFRWIATKDGKSTNFEGTYILEKGALTLARSSDNQKLSGTMTNTDRNGFNFKLTGANDSGLNFSRS